MIAQRKEAKKRENILTSHLKEIYEFNKLEEEFGQQEKKLEDEIITLKKKRE